MIHHFSYTSSPIIKRPSMREKDIGLKKKKSNMVFFLRFSEISLRTKITPFSTRCLESCQISLKPETTINVEVITKRWKERGFKSTASWNLSGVNTTPENMNFFSKNTADT